MSSFVKYLIHISFIQVVSIIHFHLPKFLLASQQHFMILQKFKCRTLILKHPLPFSFDFHDLIDVHTRF